MALPPWFPALKRAVRRAADRAKPFAESRNSAAKRRRTLLLAVAAAVAALALPIGVLALVPEPEARIHLLPEPSPSPEQTDPALLAEEIIAATGVQGEFSFVLYDSVEDRNLLTYRADATHNTMSTSKLFIAIRALELGADPAEIAKMISMSDDPIANSLWGVVGGPDLITDLAETMGLEHTTPAAEWGRWGDVQISASDMVKVVRYILTELPEDSRTVIVDAMKATTAQGSDGYDQTFGIPTAAAGLDWAVKQGWGCCKPDRFLVSAGTVGADHRYIAAIFGAFDETTSTEEQSAAEMTAIAEALVARIPA